MARSNLVDVPDVEFLHHTDKAVMFLIDGKDTWIPKSMCQVDPDPDTSNVDRHDLVTVTLLEPLAMEKGLI